MKLLFPLALFFQATLILAQDQPIPVPQPPAVGSGIVSPNTVRRRVLEMPGNISTAEILPDNYQVALLVKDKSDKGETTSELAMVTASSRFILAGSELRLNLDGVLKLEDDGSAVVQYVLRWDVPVGESQIIQMISSTVQGALRVRPGTDPEVIFRSPNRTISLSVVKLPVPKAR